MSKEEKALNQLIDAWESLPGGRYSQWEVQKWLVDKMSPAVNHARSVLKRKPK